jgi:hypothetical protein
VTQEARPQGEPNRPIAIETKEFEQAEPRTKPFDLPAAREQARLITLCAFLILLFVIVVGSGIFFALGRFSEQSLLVLISSFFTLLGTVVGFYFGQESTR